VRLAAGSGWLAGVRMVPLRARRMRLEHASGEDTGWLRAVLDAHSRPFGTRVEDGPDGTLAAAWA
jgi:poly-gamma-glutamate synthesis protein (capsule biosynthesis protein)